MTEIEKKVDEAWKEQVAKEKETARQVRRQEVPAPPLEGGTAGAPPPGGGVVPGAGPEVPFTPEEAPEPPPGDAGGEEDPDGALFESFLQGLAMQASMCLGAMPDPRTGLVHEDLGQAKHLIDIIGMLERKTRGNLGGREAQMMQMLTQDLRMAYVQRAQSAAAPPPPPPPPGVGPAGP